ncbi:hypothetical protein GCM10010104_24050 [Streptomyces indiaensis]|uniref:Uncharacterized protein n=1 Tax=Streptomyces indiaensis TaxID=284033 RepID=A0ABP5QAC3_9ACTN
MPRTLSSYSQSFLYLYKAEPLSRDGDHRNAGTALNRVVSHWERHTTEENPDWLNWFGEAQLKSTEGKVLLRSGQVERAAGSLETSVKSAAPRDKAVRSSRLAEARRRLHGVQTVKTENNGPQCMPRWGASAGARRLADGREGCSAGGVACPGAASGDRAGRHVGPCLTHGQK